jgi:hypothetical protein
MATKQEIKYKLLDKVLTAVIERKKYIFTGNKTEVANIIKLIEDYNKRNSKEKLTKVLNAFTEKIEKKKLAKKIESKKAKKVIKAVKKEVKMLKQAEKAGGLRGADIVPTKHPLKGDKRFTFKDGEVYLTPFTQIPMPPKLVEKLILCVANGVDLNPYINFWKLALLNPNPVARTKMFDYLSKHNLIVTPYGYIVTFRMVKKTDRKTQDGRPIYTSAHTRKEDYIMGTAYSMLRSECDEDGQNDCSRGLHTGSPAFIGIEVGDGYGVKIAESKVASPYTYGTGYDNPKNDKFDQTFGNQAVITLVNPMHVVSIPFSDTRKMRSCELFFVKTTTAEEVKDLTEKDYLLFDHDYREYEVAQLEKLLKETKLVDYKDDSKKAGTTAARKRKEEELKKLMDAIHYNGDKITLQLGLGDIKRIIESRIKSL